MLRREASKNSRNKSNKSLKENINERATDSKTRTLETCIGA